MTQLPSVGRDVHYVSRGSADGEFPKACRAAKVTEVQHTEPDAYRHDDLPNVGLCVTNPDGHFFHPLGKSGGIRHAAGHPVPGGETHLCDGLDYAPGTWHWPARV